MRAPAFWDQGDHWASRLLSPIGAIHALATATRLRRASVDCGAPVVCVGNLIAGGAGKTPTAVIVADTLAELGYAPYFVTRGYGGRSRGPVRVDPDDSDWRDVGDEPLLLARSAPTWVAKDRAAGAKAAVSAGATAVVLDDGFQNPTPRKDAALVVVDGGFGFGNGRVIPAGPLREPIAAGLARATCAVLVGEDRSGARDAIGEAAPVLTARLVPTTPERWSGKRVVAFAGIGRPEKFFDTLESLGCAVIERRAFPDHHPYSEADVAALCDRAESSGAVAATTEKDYVRLPESVQARVETLSVRALFDDPTALRDLLRTALGASR